MEQARQSLLNELRTIEENCLYTAQAHFAAAARCSRATWMVYVGSSVLAAGAGIFVALGVNGLWGIVSAVAGAVGAILYAFNGSGEGAHIRVTAANVLTRLRHESRATRETYAFTMSIDELYRETRRLSDAYNLLIAGLPVTDSASFEKGRALVKSNVFVPDFREEHARANTPEPSAEVGKGSTE